MISFYILLVATRKYNKIDLRESNWLEANRLVIISIMLATIYQILNLTLVFLELVIIYYVLSIFDVSVSDGLQEVVGKGQKMISF